MKRVSKTMDIMLTAAGLAVTGLAATALGIDPIVQMSIWTDSQSNAAEFTLNPSELTPHSFNSGAPDFVHRQWESYDQQHIPFMNGQGTSLATADVSYEYTSRSGAFWGDDLVQPQRFDLTLTSNRPETIHVRLRVNYPGPAIPFGSPFIDDAAHITSLVTDLSNHDGASFLGELPSGHPIRNVYEIPSLGYYAVVGLVSGTVAGRDNSAFYTTDLVGGYPRPRVDPNDPFSDLVPISVYSEAAFTLTPGDSLRLHMDRILPAPGSAAILAIGGACAFRRRHHAR